MIVATMASLATRENLLEEVVASLLPQVDALCVYLNGYRRVPRYLQHEKVLHAILSNDAGWRGAEAKLWFWDRKLFAAAPSWSPDDIALVCDDDIIYPPDYAAQHAAALARHPGSITCVHGSIMMEPFERYADSRMVARTREALPEDARVHIPGTGTMAFRFGDVDFDTERDVRWSNCVDVMMARFAKQRQIPVYSIARRKLWLQPLALPVSGMGIFKHRTGARNDKAETFLLKELAPWEHLDVPAGFEARTKV